MSEDEGFRRYLESGMAWFSVTQQKAEGILRELADSGETAMGQAQKAFERIVERGRQGSEELRDLVRSEIREQVAALGLATKDDISRLEAKIDAANAPAAASAATATAAETPPETPREAEPPPAAAGGTGSGAGGTEPSRGTRAPASPGSPPTEKA